MCQVYLKIKIKSLAEEARIIRREERKQKRRWRSNLAYGRAQHTDETEIKDRMDRDQVIFWGLRTHRTCDVRASARESLLAYGLIRGVAYKRIEQKCFEEPDWSKVAAMVGKYGSASNRKSAEVVKEWAEAA